MTEEKWMSRCYTRVNCVGWRLLGDLRDLKGRKGERGSEGGGLKEGENGKSDKKKWERRREKWRVGASEWAREEIEKKKEIEKREEGEQKEGGERGGVEDKRTKKWIENERRDIGREWVASWCDKVRVRKWQREKKRVKKRRGERLRNKQPEREDEGVERWMWSYTRKHFPVFKFHCSGHTKN